MNHLELQIEKEYRKIYSEYGAPEWARTIEPAIPFVGNDYNESSEKVLIYGSAENLTYLSGRKITENNYRRNREVPDESGFFKKIHITPVTDGSLLTAARFILAKRGCDELFSSDPRRFIEQVSVVNFCKFSIDSDVNKDYASKLRYLKSSFEYIKRELAHLKPDIVVIPHATYKLVAIKKMLASGQRDIVPIYQTNLRVINSHLNNVPINGNIYNYPFVSNWLKHGITGMPKYLSWLDRQNACENT